MTTPTDDRTAVSRIISSLLAVRGRHDADRGRAGGAVVLVCTGCDETFGSIRAAYDHETAGSNAQFGHEYTIEEDQS